MASGIPTRDIWGMFPTTVQLEEKKSEQMQADAASFGQAQQGLMLMGQPFMPATQLPVSELPAPGQQQTLPVGFTTNWEIEERPEYTVVPAIEYGGIRRLVMGDRIPIQVQPFDELEKRVGIMQAHPFDNPGLLPVKMNGAFLGQVGLRLGAGDASPSSHQNDRAPMLGQVVLRRPYNFGPVNEEELLSNPGYAMVNPLALSYTTGAYIRPGAPQWGPFPTMPGGIVYYR